MKVSLPHDVKIFISFSPDNNQLASIDRGSNTLTLQDDMYVYNNNLAVILWTIESPSNEETNPCGKIPDCGKQKLPRTLWSDFRTNWMLNVHARYQSDKECLPIFLCKVFEGDKPLESKPPILWCLHAFTGSTVVP